MKTSYRKFLIALVSIFALGLAALVFLPNNTTKRVRRAVKRQWLVLTGGLVTVDGYRLRIECKGAGSPTVVLDAGLNQTRETWGAVPQETAKFTRVCTYERAGVGESERAKTPLPRTSERVVEELHTLLQNAGEQAPFILVGHSFGGINARLYASRYPQETAGLILVDSSHEDQYGRFAMLKSPEEREEYLRHEAGGNDEQVDLLQSANEIRKAPPLPNVPLVVLSAQRDVPPEDAPAMQAHIEMQAALARLAPGGKLVVAQDSGHFIQQDKPEMVVGEIRGVYELTKNPAPAASFFYSPITWILIATSAAIFLFAVGLILKRRRHKPEYMEID